MRNIRPIIFSTALLLSTSACSYLPDWWGSDDEADAATRAKRISVLKTESLLSASASLNDTEVLLPKMHRNAAWTQANDQQIEENHHLELPAKLTTKETISIGSGAGDDYRLSAAPVIAGNTLYAVDSKGYVSAYSTNNLGKRLWRAKTLLGDKRDKGFVGGGLAYSDGKLYVTTGFDEVMAFNAQNGKELWRRQIDSITRAAPTVMGDKILVLTIDNKLFALNAMDGSLAWTHSGISETLGTLGSPSPAFSKGMVLVPYSSGELYALQGKNGLEAWYDNLTGSVANGDFALPDIDASPIVAYGKVFAASTSGLLVADDIATGNRVWEQEIPLPKTPWIAGNMMFAVTPASELVAIFIGDGRVKWVTQLPRYENDNAKRGKISWTGPVLAGGLIRVAGSHGELLSISPKDGTVVYTNEIPKEVYITPVVADGALYVLNNDADLAQLR